MKKTMKALVLGLITAGLFSLNVSAASTPQWFDFGFPMVAIGSMKYSGGQVSSSNTPYVETTQTTIKTVYFISTSNSSPVPATNFLTLDTLRKAYFTWKSGYGLSGGTYYLAGYPDASNGSWQPYHGKGYWLD